MRPFPTRHAKRTVSQSPGVKHGAWSMYCGENTDSRTGQLVRDCRDGFLDEDPFDLSIEVRNV